VFENRVLRRIFGPRRDEVTEDWRKLHNEELHNLYSSPNIIKMMKSRRMRWAGHIARMGETRNAYRILVEKPEKEIPLGRPRHWWVDNIKMDLYIIVFLFLVGCSFVCCVSFDRCVILCDVCYLCVVSYCSITTTG
jgi:hypothetical protein